MQMNIGGTLDTKIKAFYDSYDYASFWQGREYENRSDRIALQRLLRYVTSPHLCIIDIGVGSGRMIPFYEHLWKECVFLDPSSHQLAHAQGMSKKGNTASFFVQGTVNTIPLPDASCDTAICIRIFHYVEDPDHAIKEIARILTPDGFLILEIPNKNHFKARIQSWFSREQKARLTSIDPVHIGKAQDSPFLNHNPRIIRILLERHEFEVKKMLSVSNFRSTFFKYIIPQPLLLWIEGIVQNPLARFWFGPSIYFLAKKKQ
ncbi:MAG: class I SAM-dependent methyltransferase [Patescibacteria group bacterium]|nr:class I SAM-dependent methyltransferase [Patescibacteria group bacterium]